MPSTADDTEAFEHYRVFKREDGSLWELGRGAMGVTYKAMDDKLGRVVALKVINALLIDKQSSRDHFLREARAAAGLNHRNVAHVYHFGQSAQNFFYAMEFIDGETVEARVKRAGPLPWRNALGIAVQIARALMATHSKRLIHRDIKPANLMLVEEEDESDDVVKLIDFGLAKTLFEPGDRPVSVSNSGLVGTLLYASPEQCNEEKLDIRSDLYSLGVTVWFMLTGRAPFVGTQFQVIAQQLSAAPPWEKLPSDAPPCVRALVGRMMAKERDERPRTPADLRQELELCLRESPAPPTVTVKIPPLPPVEPAPSPPPPSRWFWLAAAITAAAVGLALAGYRASRNSVPFVTTSDPPVTLTPTSPSTPAATSSVTPTPALTATSEIRQLRVKAWTEAAERETEAMQNDDDKVSALSRVAVVQAESGDKTVSQQTFAQALQLAQMIEDRVTKDEALLSIVTAQSKVGNQTSAFHISQTIIGDSSKASALCAVAAAEAKLGMTSSPQTFVMALQIAMRIKSKFSRNNVLRDIAVAQAKANDVIAAMQTVQSIHYDSTDSTSTNDVFHDIAEQRERVGDRMGADLARNRIRGEVEYGERITLGYLAEETRAGRVESALQSVRKILDGVYKVSALTVIAVAQDQMGDPAGVKTTIASAIQLAHHVENDDPKFSALGIVAAAQAKVGDMDAANTTLAALTPGRHRCFGYVTAAENLLADPTKTDDD